MAAPSTTKVSFKGQVVIPGAIRKQLGLEPRNRTCDHPIKKTLAADMAPAKSMS
jgi:hypothetical protein